MSIWHLILLLVVVVVVFGTGKLTKIGPDLGAAIRGFKKSMDGDDDPAVKPVPPETLRADPPRADSAPQTPPADGTTQTSRDNTQSK